MTRPRPQAPRPDEPPPDKPAVASTDAAPPDAALAPACTAEQVARAVAEAWPRAQAHWSRFLLLASPVHDAGQQSIAQISFRSRQVSLNYEQIAERGLLDSVEALLAHEVGHHVRYPGSLAVHARMAMLERTLLPLPGLSLINLFTDLMINHHLSGALRSQLAAVYQAFTHTPAFHGTEHWKRDPSFLFYLAIYEELWPVAPGSIMGPLHAEFATHFPGFRAEARLLADNLFAMEPNLYTQFLYFVSVLSHYVTPLESDRVERQSPYSCSCDGPSDDDWASALSPTAQERAAVERAIRSGWFREADAKRLKRTLDPEERMARLPGQGTADASRVPEIMAAWYRQQAEAYRLAPPPQRRLGEAVTPTTLEEWEPGEPPRSIDWLATIIERGPELGAASPLQRTRIAEHEGLESPLWQPRLEIYLDVSGSMPDPRVSLNAMTLAAQILVLGAVRAGGRVRALLYSHEPVLYWEWRRSEVELSRFLMHYIGGGTEFPFDILKHSLDQCRREPPVRVVITDSDFDRNLDAYVAASQDRSVLTRAAEQSASMVLLLHRPDPERVRAYRGAGVSVVEVPEMDDFPPMAAKLADALFPEGSHGAAPPIH